MNHIPFNRPHYVKDELHYIREAIESVYHSGDGPFTKKCTEILETILGSPRVLLTTSCTHALEMSAILLNIQAGDEVIVPSFTFVSTINSFVLRGAVPKFADIEPDTLTIDIRSLRRLITKKTKAILLVHYGGVACDIDPIMDVANGIPVVEDNAHGLFGTYKGRPLGSIGTFSTLSFHETKNISCGEGGALIINDPKFIERAEIIREKGTDRSKFFRGLIDKYTWVDIGSSYLLSDLLAAYLFGQLEQRDKIQERRRFIWSTYFKKLRSWAEANGVRMPIVRDQCEHPSHLFYLLFPDIEARGRCIAHLKSHRISAVFHYLPLHLSKFGISVGGTVGDCPTVEFVADRLLRLPLFYDLSNAELDRVVERLLEFEV